MVTPNNIVDDDDYSDDRDDQNSMSHKSTDTLEQTHIQTNIY